MSNPLARRGSLHHVEIRVADLERAIPSWEWLLVQLGYELFQSWDGGRSWKLEDVYIVLEQSQGPGVHDRRHAGLSHLAFHAEDQKDVDRFWNDASAHGWRHLYEDRHPWAGGGPGADSDGHFAAFLENAERFKVEIVASAQ